MVSSTAGAQDQPWLADRQYTEGIGIRVGDFELHPGAAAEFGFDSNFFRRADVEDPVGSLRLRVTPSFSLSTLGPQRLQASPDAPPPDFAFHAGIAATYNEFIPVSGPDEGKDLMSEQRNVGGLLDLRLAILPQRPWSGNLEASLGRTIAPTDQGLTQDSFNRINAAAGGELIWTPGGGLLDWRLGYHFDGTIFESGGYQDLTNLTHMFGTRGRWRFLPRTAAIYDASFGFLSYPDGGKSGHPLRVQAGLSGLLTPSLKVLALVGWGASFYTAPVDGSDFDSVIGQLEVKYYLTPSPSSDPAASSLVIPSISAGFIRDYQDSLIGTYFERDRVYAKLTYFFGGRFLLDVEGGVGAIIYPNIPSNGSYAAESAWTDVRVDATAFGEYRLRDSIGFNATLRYNANLSQTTLTVPEGENSLQWQQFEAYLGVRWFM
ncbi:Hypothetical protein CAP_0026 [Chondromyces apiculatus DSM 436]|uniref:Uncharacterized protein n=1 Tax=Chondromyces apiculatus DSM 436 TaxID=1192034 RepID=A0A017TJ79_9BACT|nr:Hypothetical protein CAP_0026 [Chondromyces apiculatus DSM 436]